MKQTSDSVINILGEDEFGITYFIENAQQFWSGTSIAALQPYGYQKNLFYMSVLQNSTISYDFRVMVLQHYPCLTLHSGDSYLYALLIMVGCPSLSTFPH